MVPQKPPMAVLPLTSMVIRFEQWLHVLHRWRFFGRESLQQHVKMFTCNPCIYVYIYIREKRFWGTVLKIEEREEEGKKERKKERKEEEGRLRE